MTILTRHARRWMEEHRQRARLRALLRHDDAILEDMGLVRSEIVSALDLPIEADATVAAWNGSRNSLVLDRRARPR